jgi:hypothetical protein
MGVTGRSSYSVIILRGRSSAVLKAELRWLKEFHSLPRHLSGDPSAMDCVGNRRSR